MYTQKEIVSYSRIEAIISGYDEAQEDIEKAFNLLIKAKARLGEILIDKNPYIWERSLSCTDLTYAAENSKNYIKQQVWQYLVIKSGIKDFMSIKERTHFEDQLYNNKPKEGLPELTIENVLQTFQGFSQNSGRMRQEATKEVFEWLRPGWNTSYKTNQKYMIGRKVIKDYCFDSSYGFQSRLNYSQEPKLKALENVFTLLDGKGISHYPQDLVTRVKTACDNKQLRLEDNYFKLAWYKKGTLHIEFKRLDLLSQLNVIGNDGSLGN